MAVVFLGERFVVPIFLGIVTEKWANILALATFIGLTALVVYIYPLANSGAYGGGT